MSTKPLDLIFSNVCGSPEINSIDVYHYYVIFVDHYTRFTWLFPMKQKSDIQFIFPIFKVKIENLLNFGFKIPLLMPLYLFTKMEQSLFISWSI